MCPARQEASVHGLRIWPGCASGHTTPVSNACAAVSGSSRRAGFGWSNSTILSQRARHARVLQLIPRIEWVDLHDNGTSTISCCRKLKWSRPKHVLSSATSLRCPPGIPPRRSARGYWREMLNSDAREYAGSGIGNLGGVHAEQIPAHGRPFSLRLTLPPLAALFFKAQ